MHETKEKCNQSKKENVFIVKERNIEVNDVNMEIISLGFRATRVEEERDSPALTLGMQDKEAAINNLPGVNGSDIPSDDYSNNSWPRVENRRQRRLPCVAEPSLDLQNRFEAPPLELPDSTETKTDVQGVSKKPLPLEIHHCSNLNA